MEHHNPLTSSARQFVESIGHRKLIDLRLHDEEAYQAVFNFLQHIRHGARLWMVSNDTLLEDFWELIRESEAVCDFIMDLTAELRLSLVQNVSSNEVNGDWQRLCRLISIAYGAWGDGDVKRGPNSVIDEETFVRLPESTALEGMLRQNPWYVTLFFVNTIPLRPQLT